MKKIVIQLRQNEHWWSGTVADGFNMPYDISSKCTVNQIKNTTNNQVSPVLMSDCGRLLYNEDGIIYSFDNGELTAKGKNIVLKEVDGGLKEGFQFFKSQICPDEDLLPDKNLIIHPQYNTWIELMHNQSQDKIIEYAECLIKNNMPPGVLMIDAIWQEDYGVWDFHPGRFKDPKAMIDRLHKLGFKVMLWVAPFVSPDSVTYMKLSKEKLLVRNADGEDAVRRWWDGYSCLLDFTNPNAVKWFREQLNRLMNDYGVDGFKFDAGDPEFYRDDDITYAPITPNGQCTKYGMLGTEYTFNEYRACFGLAGKPLVQRLADKEHSWDTNGLAALIPNSIAQSLAGYRFICPDMIGGGEYKSFLNGAEIDEELFVRYAQCSALMPMMQFSANPFRVLSAENAELCCKAAWLHEEKGEMIFEAVKECIKNRNPIVAPPCYYDFNADSKCKNNFMLSDKIFVAPITEKGSHTVDVYLPKGVWKAWNGQIYTGGRRLIIDTEMGDIPYFIR